MEKGTDVKKHIPVSSISRKNYEKLKPLVFVIGNVSLPSSDRSHIPKQLQSSFALTPDGQRLAPSTSRKHYKRNTSKQYDIFIGSNNQFSGNGSAFTLGIPWLRRFFVVYDSDNQRVGVANTSYTDALVD